MNRNRSTRASLACCAGLLLGGITLGRAEIIADSRAEFSGVQGPNGWTNGWRNDTLDGGGGQDDPALDFIPFDGGEGFGDWDWQFQLWTGTDWDMEILAQGPWTYIAQEAAHPNGENSTPYYEEHWAIRRWVASELTTTTALAVTWNLRKENAAAAPACQAGSGSTASLSIRPRSPGTTVSASPGPLT